MHAFAVGDRVQFTDTLKGARIYNGNAGTIMEIDGATGLIRARLDAPAGAAAREAVWSASEFAGFRHGNAGTIYKGQGKTLDQTYLLHTHHWRRASAYVALTRQRERAQIFVATETVRDLRELARQMSRDEVKGAIGRLCDRGSAPPRSAARVQRDPALESEGGQRRGASGARGRDEERAVIDPRLLRPSGAR